MGFPSITLIVIDRIEPKYLASTRHRRVTMLDLGKLYIKQLPSNELGTYKRETKLATIEQQCSRQRGFAFNSF